MFSVRFVNGNHFWCWNKYFIITQLKSMFWRQFSCLILIKESQSTITYFAWLSLFRKQLKMQTLFISHFFYWILHVCIACNTIYHPWLWGKPCFAKLAAIFCCTLFLIESPNWSFLGPLLKLALVLVLPLPDPPPVTKAAPLDEQIDDDPLLLPLPHFTVHSIVRPLSPGIVNITQ